MSLFHGLMRKLNWFPMPLLDTNSGMARARVILDANRLGIFQALGESTLGLTPEETAQRTNISVGGAELMLTVLSEIGYVRYRSGHYVNQPVVTRWILNKDQGFTNYLRLQCQVWSRLDLLGETVRLGHPATDLMHELAGHESEDQRVYTMAMHELANLIVPKFLKKVRLPAGAKRLLDIGGAHGDFSRALASKYPGLKPTVFDLPGPIATARKLLESESLLDTVELRAGDALVEPLGTDWDSVLMASTVHAFDVSQNSQLFQRIHESLKPGGVFLILDQLRGASWWSNSAPALMSLNWFTVGGRSYHLRELKTMLRDAGFGHLVVKPIMGSTLVEAWK